MRNKNIQEDIDRIKSLMTEERLYGNLVTNKTITDEELIEEGWRDLLVGGLIVLTTLAGVGKLVHMNQEYKDSQKAKTEYYENILKDKFQNLSDEQLFDLGVEIQERFKPLAFTDDNPPTDDAFIGLARSYVQDGPQWFGVDAQGGLHLLDSKVIFNN